MEFVVRWFGLCRRCCCPVRPTGEGIALALVDAKVLGDAVAKHELGLEALRAYEDERYEPVKMMAEKVAIGARNQIPDQ